MIAASTFAARFDALFFALLALTGFVTLGVFVAIAWFCFHYRRRRGVAFSAQASVDAVEYTWIIIPLLLFIAIFVWSARLFLWEQHAPDDAIAIDVVAQQWMWKFEHGNGRREIDTLHVPLGHPVKLAMTSQDVIHSFYVPAFRIKMDVLPGRYTEAWFEATVAGEYHVFCTQYCGTSHADMGGVVVVMEPADYAAWLAGGEKTEPAEIAGARLFQKHGCASCHGQVTAPALAGIYGKRVRLDDGTEVVADDNYLRESIMDPRAKIVAGYAPLMPTFRAQLGEDDVRALIKYLATLRDPPGEGK